MFNSNALIPQENLIDLAELVKQAPSGLVIELGVYRGGSALAIFEAMHSGQQLHLFDTFTGIPERSEFDNFDIGTFNDTCYEEVKKLLPKAIFHVGIFPETLADDIQDIAFVHIDCDQYQSCKSAIELFWPRMVSGGVMAFDDYPFPGIHKAIHDYFGNEILFSHNKIPYAIKKDTK